MLRTCVSAILACLTIAAVAGTSFATPSASVAVTSCGQVVPPKTTGYLTGDLDCTGFTGLPAGVDPFYQGAAVYLEYKSALDLRGFTLTGGTRGVVCQNLCGKERCPASKCEVFSGALAGGDDVGLAGEQLTIHDVTVTGFTTGIYSYGKSKLTRIHVTDSAGNCVATGNTVILDSSITGCGEIGVVGNGNRSGIRIKRSTVLTAATADFCSDNPGSCPDIYNGRLPKLVNSTCNTSGAPVSLHPAGTWGVCALD